MSAKAIAEALGCNYPSGDWWRCRCPAHSSNGPTLALRDSAQGLICYCHAGCSSDAIRDEMGRLGLLGDDGAGVHPDPAEIELQREAEKRNRQKRISEALDYLRHETVRAEGTAIERYWRLARGLAELPIPSTIRASRSWLRHPEGGSRPAMVALVEHLQHGPVAIHRTFLAVDGSGKASFRSPRLSLGPVGGGAVHLAPADDGQLIVAEGIETAASVMVATGLPAWAALSAGGIERLVLPPLPIASIVIIAADNDPTGTGIRAARTAAERWLAEGRRVRIALPQVPGTDWNDVLMNNDNREARNAAA